MININKMMKIYTKSNSFFIIFVILFLLKSSNCEIVQQTVVEDEIIENNNSQARFTIEGRVYPPELFSSNSYWQQNTSISINSGEYKGFLKEDGSFIISSIPSGSYVVEIHNPDYFYEPLRVEINPKGKFRARKVSFIQPSQVIQVPYPLKMKAITRFRYFQQREQWKVTDFLFSPMVLMMILPLFLMLLLPRLMSDQETKKELENIQFPKMTNDMPEISEMLTSFFTGQPPKQPDNKKSTVAKPTKKRN